MKNEQEKLEDFLKSELMKEGDEILAEIEADDHIAEDDEHRDPLRPRGNDMIAVIQQPASHKGKGQQQEIHLLDHRKGEFMHIQASLFCRGMCFRCLPENLIRLHPHAPQGQILPQRTNGLNRQ